MAARSQNQILKKLAHHLLVSDFETINNVINDFPDRERSPATYHLTLHDVGAIISIETAPRPVEGNDGYTRLGLPRWIDMERHLTQVFYSELPFETARTDLLLLETGNPDVVQKRAAYLAETLAIAGDYLATIMSAPNEQKLVVHCIHGHHRSPALMLAIVLNELGKVNELDSIPVIEVMRLFEDSAFSVQNPKLREGELAFIDAYFKRDGALIEGWKEYGFYGGFRFDVAETCRRAFDTMLWPEPQAPDSSEAKNTPNINKTPKP